MTLAKLNILSLINTQYIKTQPNMSPIHSIYGLKIDEILSSIDRYLSLTPFNIENAESNVAFSLANRRELGDLNVKRCIKDINRVYVSIGGKLNDKYVYFQRPTHISNTRFPVNSIEQMVPLFIRDNNPDNKTLTIIIDNFNSKPVYDLNCLLLNKLPCQNMDIILIHHRFIESSLTLFMQYIIQLCNVCSIKPERFMICNYVKHMNRPNFLEDHDEKMIPKTIQSILDDDDNTKYENCFYEWFGYNFYLYNLIYNYKNCMYLHRVPYLKQDLENLIQKHCIDNKKYISVIQSTGLLKFLGEIYDITGPETGDNGKMATSILKVLFDTNQIMSPLADSSYNIQTYDDSNAF